MFALAMPGLGGQLAAELASFPGVTVTGSGHDGRADAVLITAEPSASRSLLRSRLAEDLFVEAGRTLRAEGDRPRWISTRLWRPTPVDRALQLRAQLAPHRRPTTVRVVVRVLHEKSFLRTELRQEMTRVVLANQPRWRIADPADLEVWVVEYQPGKLLAGLRVSDAGMRQHRGREVERRGALRPTVAAAMVRLAGPPSGVLVDPCCGSGTLLAEAVHTGWSEVMGFDIDGAAVRVARTNVPDATVEEGDARRVALPDATASAVASNLPFGQQYQIDAAMDTWLREVLEQFRRITRPGGRVVLLAPWIPATVVPAGLRLRERIPIRLLGTKTTVWAYDRVTAARRTTAEPAPDKSQ